MIIFSDKIKKNIGNSFNCSSPKKKKRILMVSNDWHATVLYGLERMRINSPRIQTIPVFLTLSMHPLLHELPNLRI